jgi:hypothetical protein
MAITGAVAGLKKEVLAKLNTITTRLNKDIFISSGKRDGGVDSSPHHSGIAVDIKIKGMKTIDIADELVVAGFSAVGEYYDKQGNEFSFAHGDIRGLPGAENSGAYAVGGAKSAAICWWREGTETAGDMHYGSRKSGRGCPV